MQLATDRGPAPMQVAAVLEFDEELDVTAVCGALADRVRAVPRLRQRLRRVGVGLGRPVWVDDPDFAIERHVVARRCPPPGDQRALLDLATATAVTRLSRERPLWAGIVVSGLVGQRGALVFVMHHVLADGIGGLAVLARLVDHAPPAPASHFPQPPPSRRELFFDATRSRWRTLTRLRALSAVVRSAVRELHPRHVAAPPRSSLNQPAGATRRVEVTHADLAHLADIAHVYDATINDLLLT
ncbi:MAG: wax ester/triacylglycerol synthase domain-containing protein, partial [Lapillicoccus sp.]